MPLGERLRTVAEASAFLTGLDPGLRAAVLARGRSATYPAGTILLNQGEPAGRLFLLLEGGVKVSTNPPSNREYVDPKTLHLSGEFTEANLGTSVAPDGQVTTRIIATQFALVPQCVVVPSDREVTLRFASPDVIHGILVTGTNVNTMVVPGYVSQVHTVFRKQGDLLMPCHEYCGFGHSQMLARVRVVPPEQFKPGADGRISCG